MRRSRRPIIIASRRSHLAKVQAESVGALLARLHPHATVGYQWIESEGDRLTDAALADAGGKGLFVRTVEKALLAGKADIAVHSMKDMPANPREIARGLAVAAVLPRADVRDCLVSHNGAPTINDLPKRAKVGTSSPRRAAQLKRLRKDLVIDPIRGNIETRLRKVLEDGLFEATLLAVAGLTRAGLGKYAGHPIDPDLILPAAAQGAIAVQCRGDDHVTLRRCLPLNDANTATAVHLERQVVAGLGGDCHSPIAVLCEPEGDVVRLRARVLGGDGAKMISADESAKSGKSGKLAAQVVRQLKAQGSDALLKGK